MITVEVSTIIHRPVADVFAYVANFENHPRWETDFLDVKLLTPQRDSVGAAYRCQLRMPGGTVESRFEVTEYVPDSKIAFVGEAAGPARPVGSYAFEALDEETRIVARPRPEFRGFFRLLEPMMNNYIRQHNEKHLSNLKAILEA